MSLKKIYIFFFSFLAFGYLISCSRDDSFYPESKNLNLHVPVDFSTIQAAIDAASNGDTITVESGVYKGKGNHDLDFKGRSISLVSIKGPEYTVIDCERKNRGFLFHENEGAETRLQGITIQNAYSSGENPGEKGAAIFCGNASPTIINCIITWNKASYGGGIGLYKASPIISNCVISGNSANIGGGIYCDRESSPEIIDCIISGNSATDEMFGKGGGIYCSNQSSPNIKGCTIIGNYALTGGGVAFILSSPVIDGCMVAGNTAEGSGGIYCSDLSDAIIKNSTIFENQAKSNNGGGMYFHYSSPLIINCFICKNTAKRVGGGIACYASSPEFTNCTITGNSSADGYGLYSYQGTPKMLNCILWNDSSREIYMKSCNPDITYSDVCGGYPGDGNINADPCLKDIANVHLSPGSPCVDSGRDVDLSYDIDGELRPWDHPESKNIYGIFDIGADEYREN